MATQSLTDCVWGLERQMLNPTPQYLEHCKSCETNGTTRRKQRCRKDTYFPIRQHASRIDRRPSECHWLNRDHLVCRSLTSVVRNWQYLPCCITSMASLSTSLVLLYPDRTRRSRREQVAQRPIRKDKLSFLHVVHHTRMSWHPNGNLFSIVWVRKDSMGQPCR